MKKLAILTILILAIFIINSSANKCPEKQPACNQDIIPSGSGYDLGSEQSEWADVYVSGDIHSHGAIVRVAKVNEAAGVTIGQIVYQNGGTGNMPQVSLADNTVHAKAHIFGMATETKANNESIHVAILGRVDGLNTNSFNEGDLLHLTTGGNYQTAVPTSGAHIHIGTVTSKSATAGSIEIITDQYIHDIRGASDNDVEIATGSDTTARKIIFEDYSGNELGYIDGSGNFYWGKAEMGFITTVSTTPYAVLDTDRYISVSTTGGARTVNLPAIASTNHGRVIRIGDASGNALANNITINPNGTDQIVNGGAGVAHVLNSNDESITLMANNTTSNWEAE